MTKRKFKTAIFGATFYGISKLIQNPDDCVLIERTTLPGREFVDSFNETGGKNIEVTSGFGKDFKSALLKNGLLNGEGEIYPAPALFLLCGFLEKISVNIMFATEITEIKKAEGGYEITCFNSEGFSAVTAVEIIDTTSECILHNSVSQNEVQKSLNVIVKKEEEASPVCLNPVIRNSLAGTEVFRFPVQLNDDYITARKKLHTFWQDNYEDLKNCKIVLTANTFAYSMPSVKKDVQSDFIWIPSCGFDNLLHAVDKGGDMI